MGETHADNTELNEASAAKAADTAAQATTQTLDASSASPPTPPPPRGFRSRFAPRRNITPEIRGGVMKSCAIRPDDGWIGSFSVMLTIAVIVAASGMAADAPVTVVGAMLIAPMMTPVLGIAAALAMWMTRPLIPNILTVLGAMIAIVVLGWILAKVMFSEGALPEEVMARTRPDLTDLVVAFASGTGAAYALVRPAISSSMTGTALAVSLVPPLVTVGVTLERARYDLAQGALLLFLANFVAIILTAVIVFVLCGFVPARRFGESRSKVLGAAALVAVCVALVAVPLTIASVRSADEGRTRDAVYAAVERWVAPTDLEVVEATVDDGVVVIDLVGTDTPPSTDVLANRLRPILGDEPKLDISWQQRVLLD